MEDNRISKPLQSLMIPEEFVVALELVTEENERDAALINTIGHATVTALLREGYTSKQSVYTGQKGIESFFVELVAVAQQITMFTENNHAAIAEALADLSGLITIIGGIIPILKRMQEVYKKQRGRIENTAHPLKMTIEIDGAPLIIEAFDINQANAALKLAQEYQAAHPTKATQVNTRSKVKVHGQIPARKHRRRR